MTQLKLFAITTTTLGSEPYTPDALARRTDPDTSHEAAAKVVKKLAPSQAAVLAVFASGRRYRMCDLYGMESLVEFSVSRIRGACNELKIACKLRIAGKEKNYNGNKVQVLEVVR